MRNQTVTPNQLSLQEQILEAKVKLKNCEDHLYNLYKQCKDHSFVELTEKDIELLRNTPWKASYKITSAVCKICNRDFGWRCPDSPDNTCHYYTSEVKNSDGKRVVALSNGLHYMADDYTIDDANAETDDCCLFCGFPEERA